MHTCCVLYIDQPVIEASRAKWSSTTKVTWSHPQSLPDCPPDSCGDLSYRIEDEGGQEIKVANFENSDTTYKGRYRGPVRVGIFYQSNPNLGCVYSELKGM